MSEALTQNRYPSPVDLHTPSCGTPIAANANDAAMKAITDDARMLHATVVPIVTPPSHNLPSSSHPQQEPPNVKGQQRRSRLLDRLVMDHLIQAAVPNQQFAPVWDRIPRSCDRHPTYL